MRKQNSSFKTAFLSEAGSELRNHDYFAFVELDKYACYVIADGITDLRNSESAKEAIHCIITEFQAAPSISKRALKKYIKHANKVLIDKNSYEQLKASVTILVTDYAKIRFAYAGNTRLRVYRDGAMLHSTYDMSLSQDMVQEDELTEDALAKHEERNNLFTYVGQEGFFFPFISPKIKLKNADIITLYTRGIWENIDEGELGDIFAEASDDPQESCDQIEDMILSRQPKELENYTFVAIFVDKIFVDPNRQKKRKRILKICVTVFVIALVVSIVLFIVLRTRKQRREEMDLCFQNTIEYIEDGNFIRAEEECKQADALAKKLRDKEKREVFAKHQKLLEALIKADDIFEQKKYVEAEEAYLSAKAKARYADQISVEYIEKQLALIDRYRSVFDNIALGDKLLGLGEFESAEKRYTEAKKDATFTYFEEGRQQSLDALENLYEKWNEAKEEERNEAAEKASSEISAAEFIKQGDQAYAEDDFEGAVLFYLIALEKYEELEDEVQVSLLNKKIDTVNEKKVEVKGRTDEAKGFEEQARLYMEESEYDKAKEQYLYAKNIYKELGKDKEADEVQAKIDIVDTKAVQ